MEMKVLCSTLKAFRAWILALCMMLIVPLGEAHAGLNQWEQLGPSGGDRYRVYIDPMDPDTIYVVMFTIHKSLEAGENWFSVDNMEPESSPALGLLSYGLSIDYTNSEVLFVSTLRGVWKSLDGGESWFEANEGIPQEDKILRNIVMDVANPEVLYVGVSRVLPYESLGGLRNISAAIYKSWDGGETWWPFDTGIPEPYTNVTAVYQNPSNRDLFAATYGDGIFKYNRSLGEWVPANTGLSFPLGLDITHLAFDPNRGNVVFACTKKDWVYRSDDRGETWEAIPFPGTYVTDHPPMAYFAIVDPNNSDYVWVSAFPGNVWNESPFYWADLDQGPGGLYLSHDGGISFEPFPWTQTIPDAGPFGITIDPSEVVGTPPYHRSKRYYMTSGGVFCLWRSTDGAASFERKIDGIYVLNANALAQHPTDGSILVTASEGDLEISFDRGESWTYFIPVTEEGLIYIWDVAVDPLNPDILYYATGNPAWDWPHQKGLYTIDLTTIDPSAEFNEGPGEQLPSTEGIGIWRVYPLENGTIYLATQNNGVMKSEDNGDTWESMNNGLGMLSVTSLVFDENLEPLIAGTRFSDGSPEYTSVTSVTSATADVASEAGRVYKWDPFLQSWSRVGASEVDTAVYSVVNSPDDPDRIYVASLEGVSLTPDGGRTWEERNWGLPRPEGFFHTCDVAIHPDEPNRVFVESWRYGVYASADGGEHWAPYRENLNQYYMQKLIIDWEYPNTLFSATLGTSILKCVTGNPPAVDSVTANGVPLEKPYVTSIMEEHLLEIQIEGHDPDGDSLTYRAFLNLLEVPAPWEVEDPDETFTFDPETRTFRWRPPFGSAGSGPYDLVLEISDGALSVHAGVHFTIEPIHPPEVDWITANGIFLTEPYEASIVEEALIEVQIMASDPDEDELTYKAFLNGEEVPPPGGVSVPGETLSFDPETRLFRWEPPVGYSVVNPHQLYFEISDGLFTIYPLVEITVEPLYPLEFMMDVAGVYKEGTLQLDFTLAAPEPATWATYLIIPLPLQVIHLWTVKVPMIYPYTVLSISFPLESIGEIRIWSALYTIEGQQALDIEIIDTGTGAISP